MNTVEEIVQYSGVLRMPVHGITDWIQIGTEIFGFLKKACPNKFKSQEAYAEAYDKEFRRLMKRGDEFCPVLLRPKLKRLGLRTKAMQHEAYFRLVMGANGYALADFAGLPEAS